MIVICQRCSTQYERFDNGDYGSTLCGQCKLKDLNKKSKQKTLFEIYK